MLNKIILLNSAKYQKAIISLDTDSIQIVGGNNIGKTTLISVLNFLYIPNKRDWNFNHDTQQTLRYYFKNFDKNYIIFEVFKEGYFCILMKRNENNKLDYYKIGLPYDEVEPHLFKKRNENNILLGFEEIETSLLEKIHKLNDKEYRTLLYGESKRDKSILWLKKDKQTVFGKIYKYLLNINLITHEVVKQCLVVADGRENVSREFSSSDNDKIENMQQKIREVERLKANKIKFNTFKEMYSKFTGKQTALKKMYATFSVLYPQITNNLQRDLDTVKSELENIDEKRLKPLSLQRDKLIKNIAGIELNIKHKKEAIVEKQNYIQTVESYGLPTFIQGAISTKEKKHQELQYNLRKIKVEGYTKENIQLDISKLENKEKNLTNQIDNYKNLLIHHISDTPEMQQKINTLFSSEVLTLDKTAVLQKVSKDKKGVLELFDGLIDVSSIAEKKFLSIESIEENMQISQKELRQFRKILTDIINYDTLETDINQLSSEINKLRNQLSEIEKLPVLKEEISVLENDKKTYFEQLEVEKVALKKKENEIKEVGNLRKSLESNKEQHTSLLNSLEASYQFFEDDISELGLIDSAESESIDIDDLIVQMKVNKKEVQLLKEGKDKEFNELKYTLYKEHANEESFIHEIQEDIDTIKDKENTINKLVKAITDDISTPTETFLKELELFEGYINSLSTTLKKYKISDLYNIELLLRKNNKLIKDLKLIASIRSDRLFSVEDELMSKDEQLEVLKKYIADAKTYTLNDLFEVAFKVNDNEVDLSKQVESTGTNRMLKILLFILIMKGVIVQDESNKLVLYIDELGEVDDDNSFELIKRCKENNFIPIFAGPDKKPNIDKYYDLLKSGTDGKIIVDDVRAIYAKDRI